MNGSATPELAILLVADSLEMIRKVLRFYAAQTNPQRLEVVVAAYAGSGISDALVRTEGFLRACVVDAGGGDLAQAEARAVRAATAPYVVFAQAHAYPRRAFVEAILAACQPGPWTVIGPTMANANPANELSRAAMRINYGPWWGSRHRGPADTVPGHNSAYDRSALLALGDDLERVLTAGRQLQVELIARGATLFLEPAACIEIVNVSQFWWFCADLHRQGRRFAAERRLHWSLARRVIYAGGAPLIPAVRLWRMLHDCGDRIDRADPARAAGAAWNEMPALLLGLIASAAGEMIGYLAGRSGRRDFDDTSFHRLRYVSAANRRADADERTWPPARSPGA